MRSVSRLGREGSPVCWNVVMGLSRELKDKSNERLARRRCSDPGDDLDPSLVHRLESLSLLLRISVRDSADEVLPPAVDDLVGMWSDDDLVDQHLGQRADQQQIGPPIPTMDRVA